MSDHLIAEANRHAKALSKMTLPTTKPNDRDLDWYVRECESLHERNKVLEAENAELREKFATIPDEVWSKADLVKQIHQAIDERNQADQQNAALREDKKRLDSGTILLTLQGERVHHVRVNLRAAIDCARKEAQP